MQNTTKSIKERIERLIDLDPIMLLEWNYY